MTRSCGSAPADGDNLADRRGHDAAADSGGPDRRKLVTGVGLVDGRDEAGGVDRAGLGQQRPLLELARAGAPRGVHGDQLRPALRELDVELGKADVVAQGDADADPVNGDHHRIAARRDGVRLGEAERVVQVDLVVVRVDSGPGGDQRVGHPRLPMW